ncbi:MAG: DinB family protein [Acidimicrobiia bacterium]
MPRSEQIDAYREGPARLRQAWKAVPEEARHHRPEESEWSPHEIVIHVADAEVNGYVRFRKLVAEPGADIGAYEQDEWAGHLDYLAQDPAAALNLIELLRGLTGVLLDGLSDDAWSHVVHHPEQGEWTLDDWLRTYSSHIDAHLIQMEEAVSDWRSTR